MKKKNILVLATLDERGRGHGWSQYIRFKELGHNVQFLCLLRTQADTPKEYCIIDSFSKYSWRYIWYKLWGTLEKIMFAPYPSMRAMYKGVDYASSNDILKRLQHKPDLIVVCSYQFFLSPHSLYKIYNETKSEMCFIMVDEKTLGGGCPYPQFGCEQYITGCKNCPYYRYEKFIPRKIYEDKVKWFSKIPFHLIGAAADIRKAKQVPFLRDKQLHAEVTNPKIPFELSKEEARKRLNLPHSDYIIMCGAVNLNDWKKGFKEFAESLAIFAKESLRDKTVSVLLLTKNQIITSLPDSIRIISLGFLDMDSLYTAFYASDVFASPSIMDSGPMMVNYSMACGRPVVAFPVGIAQDLVVHKETGWMAEMQNITDFAKGLEYFYQLDDQKLLQAGEKCKNHVKKSSEKYLDYFMNIFIEPVNE